MIDWAAVRPAIQEVVGEITQVETEWISKPRRFVSNQTQARVSLRVRRHGGDAGLDELTWADLEAVAPAPTLVQEVRGLRYVDIELRAESWDHNDDRFAFNIANRVETKIKFDSYRDRLKAVGVSVIKSSQTIDLQQITQDDRALSVAVLELFLSIAFCTRSDDLHYNIETAVAVGTLHPVC